MFPYPVPEYDCTIYILITIGYIEDMTHDYSLQLTGHGHDYDYGCGAFTIMITIILSVSPADFENMIWVLCSGVSWLL